MRAYDEGFDQGPLRDKVILFAPLFQLQKQAFVPYVSKT